MPRFQVIGFDADDTLWHNEKYYIEAQSRFRDIVGRYGPPGGIDDELHRTEMRNLEHYGYGIKGYALSMIETAVRLSGGMVSGQEVMKIISIARDLLDARVELLDHASSVIPLLSREFPLMLVTKGDLRDQESKIERSGLSKYFRHVEILSNKGPENYRGLLRRHGIPPEQFVMVGNSLRSDIWPVLQLGGAAIYVPHHFTWAHEAAEPPASTHPGYHAVEHLGLLPGLLERLDDRRGLVASPGAPRSGSS
jgi:putative hydrolase of the HAD superfamily